MNNWRSVDEIITYYGKGVTPKYVDESSIIVLNQKCIRNNKINFSFAQFIDDKKSYNEEKFLKIGDILINSTGQGTAGRVAMLDNIPNGYKIIVDSHILVLRTNDFFESKCLNYSLFSIESLLQTFMDGSTGQGEFDKIRLFNVKVGYSSDNKTQQKIAAVLSALDDKIELNNKINAELEAMAKTLYDYWFVQFEFPVASSVASRASANEAATATDPEVLEGYDTGLRVPQPPKGYKSSDGAMEYNSTLKREIPKGWEVRKIGDLLKKIDSNRKLSAKEYYLTGKLPIVDQSTDFIAGFTDNEDYKISINKNDPAIIFGDHTRILKLINFDFVRGADGTQVLFTNSNKMPQYLFYHSLLKIDLSNYGYARHFKFLKDRFVVVPDEDLANRFNMVVKSFFDKALSNQKQNQELAQLRDWLLPMLMNGQVKVDDVEDEVVRMAAEPKASYN